MQLPRDCFVNLVVALSHDIRASVLRIFTCRKLVAKVLNMLKNCMQIFLPKYFARLSRDCRATRDVRASDANLSPRNFGEFTMQNFRDTRTNVVRVSHDGRATVLRQHAKNLRLSGEKINFSDIRTDIVRHSHECRATVVQIKMKIRYIRGKVMRHSRECRTTVMRQSRDNCEIYFQNKTKIREFVA